MTSASMRFAWDDIPRPARLLGFAGIAPQAFAVLAALSPTWRFAALSAGFFYSALILSFVGGVWWGVASTQPKAPQWAYPAAVAPIADRPGNRDTLDGRGPLALAFAGGSWNSPDRFSDRGHQTTGTGFDFWCRPVVADHSFGRHRDYDLVACVLVGSFESLTHQQIEAEIPRQAESAGYCGRDRAAQYGLEPAMPSTQSALASSDS